MIERKSPRKGTKTFGGKPFINGDYYSIERKSPRKGTKTTFPASSKTLKTWDY